LPSNIVLNPVDATHRLASIGSMVPGTGLSATTFQLTGVLSGTGGVEKIGPGVLQLNAQNISGFVNSYQDSTRIRQGTLTINYGSNLGTGPLVMYELSASPTVLNLNNTSQTIASLSSYWTNTNGNYSQTVNINGCTLTDNQSTNTTFGNGTGANLTGLIAGTGNFIKSGTGTLTLTGPNTYTGLTQVAGGTLALSHTAGTTLPATNTVDIIGGTLSVNTTQTLKNVTLSTGTLNVASGVTLTITGTFTLVNGTITGGGTIAYTNGTLIYAGSVAQTVNTGNSPVEWPTTNAPTNITFDNYTYTGYTSGGVKLIAGKTISSGGIAT
jgi:autotransporter-associated beta strand protein